jgi:hypothetical protein
MVASLLLSASAKAQEPPLRTVIDRLHAYLGDYAVRLPATIATEHYEQRCAGSPRVVLESEFGTMRMDKPAGWLGVRDVMSVDGQPVANREERLQALVRNPSARTIEQARRIAQENARFNVGPIRRTINDPAIVLALLDDANGTRLRFTRAGDATIDGSAAWIIRFDERQRPTLIQSTTGRDQPAKGRAWVDPATGRLMRAEMVVESPLDEGVRSATHVPFMATILVEFADEPRLGLWVPSKMTESYTSFPCSGDATYTDYRTFGVDARILSP